MGKNKKIKDNNGGKFKRTVNSKVYELYLSIILLLNIGMQNVFASSSGLDFFQSGIETIQTVLVALGAGLAIWGVVNLLEGYGSDNPGANAQST